MSYNDMLYNKEALSLRADACHSERSDESNASAVSSEEILRRLRLLWMTE